MSLWTLTHASGTKSFAGWGLKNLQRRRANQERDTVTFEHAGAAVDSIPLFAYDDLISIIKDGVPWFSGTVSRTPRMGSGRRESVSYEVNGPWFLLERHTFQQPWTLYSVGTNPPTFQNLFLTHFFLGQWPDGTRMTSGMQAYFAFKFVIDAEMDQGNPHPFQFSTAPLNAGVGSNNPNPPPTEADIVAAGFPGFFIPFIEGKEKSCAEIVHDMFRWSPDVQVRFDYSTVPPTLIVKQRPALPQVFVSMVGSADLSIHSREDLQLPAVVVHYERQNSLTVNGESRTYVSVTTQKAPNNNVTGRERDTLMFTLDLQGLTETISTVTLVTATWPGPDNLDWWRARIGADIGNPTRAVDLSISSTTRKTEAGAVIADNTLLYELRDGQVPDWLQAVQPTKLVVSALATFDWYSDDGVLLYRVTNKPITYAATFILIAGNTFKNVTLTPGEPDPTVNGNETLATQLYLAVKDLHWEGNLTLVADEVGEEYIGKTLNITGGKVEWQTMKALVQQVSEHVDSGRTEITFGPPSHLGIPDLVELLRANRYRLNYTIPARRVTGQVPNQILSLGRETSRSNSTSGEAQYSVHQVPHTDKFLIESNAQEGRLQMIEGKLADLVTVNSSVLRSNQLAFRKPSTADPGALLSHVLIDASNRLIQITDNNTQAMILLALADAQGKVVKLQKTDVCINGVHKQAIIMRSDYFDPI